jgi:hypothetical protein
MLACEIKGLKPNGHRTLTGFVMPKGSQAVLKERASAHKYSYPYANILGHRESIRFHHLDAVHSGASAQCLRACHLASTYGAG